MPIPTSGFFPNKSKIVTNLWKRLTSILPEPETLKVTGMCSSRVLRSSVFIFKKRICNPMGERPEKVLTRWKLSFWFCFVLKRNHYNKKSCPLSAWLERRLNRVLTLGMLLGLAVKVLHHPISQRGIPKAGSGAEGLALESVTQPINCPIGNPVFEIVSLL